MTRKTTRQRNTRRDRRKAKEVEYLREGRSNSNRVGHGGGGMRQQPRNGTIQVYRSLDFNNMLEDTVEHVMASTHKGKKIATSFGKLLKKKLNDDRG